MEPLVADSLELRATVTTPDYIYNKFLFYYFGGHAEIRDPAGRAIAELDGVLSLVNQNTWQLIAPDGTFWDVVRAGGCNCGGGVISERRLTGV